MALIYALGLQRGIEFKSEQVHTWHLMDPENQREPEPLEVPVDGVLDLHTFRPAEVKEVVLAYIEACQDKGIHEIRIIHGKGIGTLRERVHAVLAHHAAVKSFSLAPGHAGGWGATLVSLK